MAGKKVTPKKNKKPKFWSKFDKKRSSTITRSQQNNTRDDNSFDPNSKKSFSKDQEIYKDPPKYDFEKGKDMQKKKGVAGETKSRINEGVRLNKFIANSGVCSRREADQLITDGKIKVNGQVVTEMGMKVKPADKVVYKGKRLKGEQLVYVLLNKPRGFITTMEDPHGRKTVMDLVGNACKERIYPVGRLDRNTTGLLLFTNDGDLAGHLTHPSNNIIKVYRVELDKPMTKEHFESMQEGIELEDGPIKPDKIAINEVDKTVVGIEIHSGRNRIVRRMFEHFGYTVERLDRTGFAGVSKKDISRGKWRFLTEQEVIRLKFLKQRK